MGEILFDSKWLSFKNYPEKNASDKRCFFLKLQSKLIILRSIFDWQLHDKTGSGEKKLNIFLIELTLPQSRISELVGAAVVAAAARQTAKSFMMNKL